VNGVISLRFRPKIAVVHDIGLSFTANRLLIAFAKRMLRGYDTLICVSNKTRDEVRSVLGLAVDILSRYL